MAWTDPRTWLAGEEPAASVLNAHIRDNLKALTEYTSYTPALSSNGTQPTTSTAQGGFISAGKLRIFWARLVIATAGTGSYEVTLPATAARVYTPGLCGHFLDLSAVVTYAITAVNFSTTEFRMTVGAGGFVGAATPVAAAAGDEIVIGGTYEAA